MKCQRCEKPATFHITELTGSEPQELHLCESHARHYLTKSEGQTEDDSSGSLAGVLANQLKINQTAEDLARLDQQVCPVCGITFYEFRSKGRLGCPHDYDCFQGELEPLIASIHGDVQHKGKRPQRSTVNPERQTELIRMRREMKEAIELEEYETASKLRDEIRRIQGEESD